MSFYTTYPPNSGGATPYTTFSAFPPAGSSPIGSLAYAEDTGILYVDNGTVWEPINSGATPGTVTSVGMTVPSFLTVTGSPITTAGTLAVTLNTETANTVFAGPTSGGAAAPTFRTLVAGDLPSGTGTVTSVSIVPANGLAGTVATATTTPAITLSTSVTGILQGNGTAISAASTTGSGAIVLATSPTLVTPALGTPSALILTNATGLPVAGGGTGASSLTLDGIVYGNGTSAVGVTAAGTTGQVLTATTGSAPTWQSPASSGTVTSVGFADTSTTPIYTITNSPVTSSGTIDQTLKTQSANLVFAGPSSGGSTQPTFRSLVSADIPSLSGTYVTQSEVGAANGVAALNASSKIPVAYLPNSVLQYEGTWNPTTNTPTLQDSTGTAGFVYWVSALFAGPISGLSNASMVNFQIGDLVIYNGTQWELTTPAAGVSSVNGAQGAVTVNAINQLTGDVTAGPASGSASATASLVATSNGTLTSLTALTSAASLNHVGTITTGAWQGTTVNISYGGTSATTAAGAFNNLNPMTTTGDTIYESGTNTAARLAIGATGQVLTVSGGVPTWASPATSGTVTSVAVSGGTTGLTTSGGPITTSGTITLSGTLAVANGGTGVTTSTGTGNNVLSNSPTLVTPALGTPSSVTLTNATGYPTSTTSTAGIITLKAPTQQIFTSGASGTYTTPAGVLWLRVRAVGAGGGGGGGGVSGTAGAGVAGNNTTFGTLTASGGSGGANGGSYAAGGTSTLGTDTPQPTGINFTGGYGEAGTANDGIATTFGLGGMGGASGFGGGGGGQVSAQAGANGAALGSGGGGGGSGLTASAAVAGAGGGAGGFIDVLYSGPKSSYTYAVGGTSVGGTAGTTGGNGGNGAPGYILVEEHYY
jgi:hypothetical protein